ncbi:unnamed protein product [Amoebophrya sp. A120]|nr:unnamed protein product [Amoebophrya sp. A120]|eukprot:GSA120T00024664001.1
MGKGGKGKGGFGKGKGKGKSFEPEGPPERVEELGETMHTCEDQLIVKCTHNRVPQFNARIFLQNKEQIGNLDEIFGPINDYMFSVKMAEGMKAGSFKKDSKVFIDPMKTLDFSRFLPQKAGASGGKGGKKGGKGGKGGKGKGGDKGGKGGKKGGAGKGGVSKGGGKPFAGRGGKGK